MVERVADVALPHNFGGGALYVEPIGRHDREKACPRDSQAPASKFHERRDIVGDVLVQQRWGGWVRVHDLGKNLELG